MPQFRSISIAGNASELAVSQPNQKRLRRMARQPIGMSAAGEEAYEAPLTGEETELAQASLAEATPEAACRNILQTLLEDMGNETMLEITSPDRPQTVPDFRATASVPVADLPSQAVTFEQTAHGIPVFGGRVVVDVGEVDNALVAVNGKVSPLPQIDPMAKLGPSEAFQRLLAALGSDGAGVVIAPPVLEWFLHEPPNATEDVQGIWHLTYHFSSVPLLPVSDKQQVDNDDDDEALPCCVSLNGIGRATATDFFVDAHSGEIVYFFPSASTVEIPVDLEGTNYDNMPVTFFGLKAGPYYLLRDPQRNIETYDFAFGDIDANPMPPLPARPFSNGSNRLTPAHAAATCAHYNATLVFDFFNDVLKRKSIDDKGMKLVSIVNVDSRDQNPLPPPQWPNAAFWQDKMWYGQTGGQSWSRFLDIIGHELAHGVTRSTSGLVYRDIPGALNESFSDIFGVMINNWYPQSPEPVIGWNWEMGPGLGRQNGPLRDMSDPARCGQPDHMNQYVPLPYSKDNGGVHIYSGIHNKAAYYLLTGTNGQAEPVDPIEAALLYYLTLSRLTPTSKFTDCRRTIKAVATARFDGNPAKVAETLQAIDSAYDAVGIT